MAALLTYYPSEGLTQAEKNLARWQQHLARATAALEAARLNVEHIYPATPPTAQRALGQRRAYLRPLEGKVAQYAEFVAQAKNIRAGERAAAYGAYLDAITAAQPRPNWLVRVVGTLVLVLMRVLPTARLGPPVAF